MRLVDYLDKGASLGPDAACFSADGEMLTYRDVQGLTYRIARALQRDGVRPGEKVAVLSGNDPVAFACVFGISRAGTVWCPINPRNEAAENRFILEAFDCVCLIYQSAFASLVERILPDLPAVRLAVCLDQPQPGAPSLATWLAGTDDAPIEIAPPDDLVMIAGTGGTTGVPKGVMLTGRNLETMSAITLMSYPFRGRPVYLALAPLTHAAGVLCLPLMTLGARVEIMRKPDLGVFLSLIKQERVTHAFLPPTLIYALLAHPMLEATNMRSIQCFWYGAAPMSAARLEEALTRITPFMAQLFGQTEAPMMISVMPPRDHFNDDGSVARHRLASAGRPAPLLRVEVMLDDRLLARGERGEIVVRGSLVMAGYYKNPEATAEAFRHGWHHTGDIGFIDDDNFLHIVDRAKDMIITGGFNVYSAEVEQALLRHPDVQDCAVIGLPDEKWGEMVVAVVQPQPGRTVDAEALRGFVREHIGGVKAPKRIEIWPDLPRSKVGKVIKAELRAKLAAAPLSSYRSQTQI
jgi:fatty-acyl-CoA synthase